MADKISMNILITGATDGIGLALAKHYQAQHMRLILVGRKPLTTLDPTFFNTENYCQSDLSQPNATARIVDWLNAKNIQHIDLALHNAGVGWYGNPDLQPSSSIDELLQVNLSTPLALTHALLPRLQHGRIVFISSVAANAPAAKYAVYAATKSALDGFARSLRVESSGKPFVQIIHIGAARTNMHVKLGIAEQLNADRFPSAEWTAEQITRAVQTKKSEVTIGAVNQILRWVGSHLPSLIDSLAGRRA